jgi:hypothetical protein
MPEHAGQPGAGWPARRMPMNTRTPLQMSLISRHQARRLRRHAVLLRQGLSGWRVEADTPAWCRNAGLGNATGRECAAAGRNPDKGRQVAGFCVHAAGWSIRTCATPTAARARRSGKRVRPIPHTSVPCRRRIPSRLHGGGRRSPSPWRSGSAGPRSARVGSADRETGEGEFAAMLNELRLRFLADRLNRGG